MADLLRLSRPWRLLSPLQPRAPSLISSSVYRSVGINVSRPYASRGRGHMKPRSSRSTAKKGEPMQVETGITLLLPYTLVAPPLWRYPRRPRQFFHMLWLHAKARAQGLWAILSMKFLSQPTVLISRPRFKFHRSALIPTAKALHVQMSEAMAVGDKETLRRICTPELFLTLASAIDSRPKGVRAEWNLVRYDRTWLYPRLADWRIGQQPQPNGDLKLVKQAVVSIASVQQIARYDDSKGGIKIPGSERIRPMTEHIVLQAVVNHNTYESEPWKIWGTLSEATYEEYLSEVENIEAIMAEQAKT